MSSLNLVSEKPITDLLKQRGPKEIQYKKYFNFSSIHNKKETSKINFNIF